MTPQLRETRQTYDLIAAEFARKAAAAYPELTDDAAWFAAGSTRGGWNVDVGCGPGRDVAVLRRRGLRVVGLDLSVNQIRAGGLSGMAQADMRCLPLADGSATGVWCQAALLHVPHAEVPAVLGEFGRVVLPGGKLHLSVAEGDGEGWEAATNYGMANRRWFAYHREPGLSLLLSAAGFDVRSVRRTHRYRDWLAIRAVRAGHGPEVRHVPVSVRRTWCRCRATFARRHPRPDTDEARRDTFGVAVRCCEPRR